MEFRNWLLCESKLLIKSAPELANIIPQAENALRKYLDRYKGPDLKSASNRYQFVLEKYDDSYWDYTRFVFTYALIEKKRGTEEIATPDDYRREYMSDWDGKTGYRLHKTPKDAIEEIPVNSQYAYRGMSWEEWKKISMTGQIQSFGSYNFGNQKGLTFYGSDPGTGEIYAGGFTPMAFMPTPTKPGIVIAIPKELLKDHRQNSNIPQGELAHEGPLPINHIAEVYMLVATRSKSGMLELMVKRENGRVAEGSRSNASISYKIRRLK